jgi:hypothetical protein
MAVYFARSGAYMKIGYSADPTQRVATITTAGTRPDDVPYAADAQLFGWIPGDRIRESQVHRCFSQDRVAGEWFYLSDAPIRDLIWSDPRGIDIQRMSAVAVFVGLRYPQLVRDEMAALGVPVEASTIDTIDWSFLETAGGAA